MKTRWLPIELDGKTMVFGGFLLAGNFKADPRLSWLPVDLTLLLALLTIAYLAIALHKNQYRLPLPLFWMWGLFFLFLLPLYWIEWTAYGTEKVWKLFSFTLLAAIAPLFLCKGESEIRNVFQIMTCLAIIMGVDSFTSWLLAGQGGAHANSTGMTAFGSSTIALGRTTGLAFLWIFLLAVESRMNAALAIGLLAFFLLVLIGSGSRGPLMSLLAVAAVAGPLYYGRKGKQIGIFCIGLLILSLVMTTALSILPQSATNRIQSFLEGDLGASELSRLTAFERSWETIAAHPFGIGWGGFAHEINLWQGETRQYPHNIWLEITLEGGWLAGLALLALFYAGFSRLYRHLRSFEARALFAALLYFLLNAMVSGDINDNKLLFALAGVALVFTPRKAQEHAEKERKEHEFTVAVKREVNDCEP
ncbi:O-antigen ligase family protein [Brevibacillus ruminantium]|uniref:O-antigen ligase family protein n=1 Tax=Brevibacillus ruminantium TaxID=2950604 RepID=A0ABY4WJ63_9BACL|nr:O-antigen ligase family protein [Brevibacillus ruminantium]USG67137.1 O-antigen ligase family protein [Brevibacillus ruminantium]